MKAVLKLIVTAIVLNAGWRAGLATWNYYQFKDAAQQVVTFGGREQPGQIQARILAKAIELDLPVSPAAVTVRRDGLRTEAEASYVQPVELFPAYAYPMAFSFSVNAVSLTGLK